MPIANAATSQWDGFTAVLLGLPFLLVPSRYIDRLLVVMWSDGTTDGATKYRRSVRYAIGMASTRLTGAMFFLIGIAMVLGVVAG